MGFREWFIGHWSLGLKLIFLFLFPFVVCLLFLVVPFCDSDFITKWLSLSTFGMFSLYCWLCYLRLLVPFSSFAMRSTFSVLFLLLFSTLCSGITLYGPTISFRLLLLCCVSLASVFCILCFGIHTLIFDGVEKPLQTTDANLEESETDDSPSSSIGERDISSREIELDIEEGHETEDSLKKWKFHPYLQEKVSKKNFLWGILFILYFHFVWLLLALLTIAMEELGPVTIKWSFVVIIIFHVIKFSGIKGLIAINNRLPPIQQTKYLPEFFQIFFLLFYRSIFTFVNEWGEVVGAAIASLFLIILAYPVAMTPTFYFLVYERVKTFTKESPRLAWVSRLFRGPSYEPELSYESYVTRLCIHFFYQEIADYYSIFVFALLCSLLRWTWNWDCFVFSNLESNDFEELLYRYLFLFLFELVSRCLIRIGVWRFLKIDISKEASLNSVGNRETRKLLSKFATLFIASVYLTLVDTKW